MCKPRGITSKLNKANFVIKIFLRRTLLVQTFPSTSQIEWNVYKDVGIIFLYLQFPGVQTASCKPGPPGGGGGGGGGKPPPPDYSTGLETELRELLFDNYSKYQRPQKRVQVRLALNLMSINYLVCICRSPNRNLAASGIGQIGILIFKNFLSTDQQISC